MPVHRITDTKPFADMLAPTLPQIVSQAPWPKDTTRTAHAASRVFPVRHPHWRQAGFSLVEIGFVVLIITLIATFGIPAAQGLTIESRVPSVSNELKRVIANTKVLGEGDSVTPYAGINNVNNLSKTLQGSSVVRVTNATVAHRLGGAGTGTNGTITIAPAALGGGAVGSAFSLTLSNVSKWACPVLAGTLNAVAESMRINGAAVKTLADDGTVTLPYNPTAAQQYCTAGDSNTFVFLTR